MRRNRNKRRKFRRGRAKARFARKKSQRIKNVFGNRIGIRVAG